MFLTHSLVLSLTWVALGYKGKKLLVGTASVDSAVDGRTLD